MKFFKKLTSVILLVVIIANSFNYLFISATYQFNKSYISSVFCTNKNQPELHCEGKCFLDIKLKELDQKNKKAQEQTKRIIETIYPQAFAVLSNINETELVKTTISYLRQQPTMGNANRIFHPPKISCLIAC